MIKLFTFFLLFVASSAFSQITIEGQVTDANGKAPILAHAHIGAYNGAMENSTSTECSKDGHYSIQAPKAGIYTLRISAVDHQEISLPLILDEKDKKVIINIQLRSNPFNKEPEKITVIGDWNKFAFASTEQMLPQKTKDGKTIFSYQRKATSDTLSYQLIGVAEGGHSVNGTKADYFTYDGGGDYRSVLRTRKGDNVTITFDSSLLHYSEANTLPIVDIKNNPFLKKAYELNVQITKMQEGAVQKPVGGGPAIMSSVKYKKLLDTLNDVYRNAIKSDDNRFSQFVAILLAKQFNPEIDFGVQNAELVIKAVPPTSPMIAMAPFEVVSIAGIVDKKTSDTYLQNLKNNPEKAVRAIVYADEMEHAIKANDTKEWKRVYTLLKKDYADVPDIKWTIIQNNPDAIVQVGKPVPAFEVTLLDGSTKISNTSMLGKYYMIDFWATWCGPCVREMPAIHKAYDKFKGKKGFEILSLSMDAEESQIAPFRAKKWKMPWLNAFIPGVFEAGLAERFEVAGIPKPVLVGPDGKIVATQEDLRGETLEATLQKFLGESN